jgi:hypothetical protein
MRETWIAAWGLCGAVWYLFVVACVFWLLADEGEPILTWTLPILAGPAAAALLFAAGSLGATGTRYWSYRVIGWIGMLLGSGILISFAFLLWPVLLLEMPLLWKWSQSPADATA